ncbi:MAG: methylenetetrahydrofolate reductase C-terminal domain-containing protein [Thermodesulfobacteriota bacterium]|nr:methylenetetrahydrofolate reductase C-terminal domain-containing protein [Deltaproteobacteria bacterium]
MIVAERKPVEEIKQALEGYEKILIVGCGTCVAVCMAGGEREVGVLASMLKMSFKMEGKEVEIGEVTVERQCDKEFMQPLEEKIKDYQVVISLACGIGVQFLSELYEGTYVMPGVNTRFLGSNEGEGMWQERCRACGECVLAQTGGVCPITICAKGLLNGPCGGTNEGKCEVDKDKDCAWTLIYQRLEKLGKLDNIRSIFPPKNYQTQTTPARMTHEAYQKGETE